MTTRVPTIDEIARALAYIEHEFVIRDGRIDGELWAEGLAFSAPMSDGDVEFYRDTALEIFGQLSPDTWKLIAARADFLRQLEGTYNSREERFGTKPRYAIDSSSTRKETFGVSAE